LRDVKIWWSVEVSRVASVCSRRVEAAEAWVYHGGGGWGRKWLCREVAMFVSL
jgi:hypothetical protein